MYANRIWSRVINQSSKIRTLFNIPICQYKLSVLSCCVITPYPFTRLQAISSSLDPHHHSHSLSLTNHSFQHSSWQSTTSFILLFTALHKFIFCSSVLDIHTCQLLIASYWHFYCTLNFTLRRHFTSTRAACFKPKLTSVTWHTCQSPSCRSSTVILAKLYTETHHTTAISTLHTTA